MATGPRGRRRMMRGAAGLLAFGLLLPSGMATAAPEEGVPEAPGLMVNSSVSTVDGLASGTAGSVTKVASMASAIPSIAGTAVVGETLLAKPGNWTDETEFTYQWNADGAAIRGATDSSLTLTMAQLGKAVTVTVTGSQVDNEPISQTSAATPKVKGRPGWFSENWEWYYFGQDGSKQTGWVSVGRTWYYMNSAGVMQTGWVKVGSQRYYLNESGAMQTGWAVVGGTWYYLKADGSSTTGWAAIGGKWYYLNPSAGGAMATGWTVVGGKWYYMNTDGAMRTGWLQLGGKWYYLQPSGAMESGWTSVGGSWYYMNANGAMQTGWLQQGSNWYYLKSSGVMVTGSYTIDGRANSFASSGLWLGYASTGSSSGGSNGSAYYKNCTAVWNAIGRPIYRGQPGYGSHLDRDGDGKGCEIDPR